MYKRSWSISIKAIQRLATKISYKKEIAIEIEKQIYNSIQQLMKQGKIIDKIIKETGQQVQNQRGFMA